MITACKPLKINKWLFRCDAVTTVTAFCRPVLNDDFFREGRSPLPLWKVPCSPVGGLAGAYTG